MCFLKCCFKLNKLFGHLPLSPSSLSPLFLSWLVWVMKYAIHWFVCFFLFSQNQKSLYTETSSSSQALPLEWQPNGGLEGRHPWPGPISTGDLSPHLQRSCLPQPGLLPPTVPGATAAGLRQEPHLSQTMSQSSLQHTLLRPLLSDSILTGKKLCSHHI